MAKGSVVGCCAVIAAASVVFAAVRMHSAKSRRSLRLRRHMHWVRRAGFNQLLKELAIAVELAVACGEAMLETAGTSATHLKDGDDGIDPQTATDLSNERLVMDTLRATFPEHAVIGEETVAAMGTMPSIDARPTWIVDPIDGTQNFCHGLPVSCVSIGYCINGLPELGVICQRSATPIRLTCVR